MSGQHAIRGFVYQTIASALHSLIDSDWEYLTIEPNTQSDKVDMLWEDKAGKKKCQQVKSSINNFNKAGILYWLEVMVRDIPDAHQYDLILIGHCSANVTEFINDLSAKRSSDISSALASYADRIRVEMLIFNFDMLQGHVQNEVHRFLSQHNFSVTHDTLTMITGGLLYQFLEFSVLGTRASKDQWREELIGWLTSNYRRGLNLGVRQDRLTLGIYFPGNRQLETAARPIRQHFDVGEMVNIFFDEAMGHFKNVVSISLPSSRSNDASEWRGLAILSMTEFTPVKIGPEDQSYIVAKVSQYLHERVPDGFFNVGDLTRNLFQPGIFGYTSGYKGTKEEEAKYHAYLQLRWTFEKMDEMAALFEFVNRFFCLPLVLQNSGTNFDEEVQVTLKIPENVQLVRSDTFYVPDDNDLLKMLSTDVALTDALRHIGDSFVYPYLTNAVTNAFDHQWESFLNILSPSEQLERRKKDFVRRIGNLFDREIFDDLPGLTQIRYQFSKINPNVRIAFPSYLLFEAEESFVIEYEITSRNTSAVQTGQLIIEIS
jgi:hypothetical protein